VQGVDEIAIFIITPVPGSQIEGKFEKRYQDYSELNFSPAWREDYEKLNRTRLSWYRMFLALKARKHPLRFAKQPFNFLFRHFETKMEMVPYRAIHTWVASRWGELRGGA
jgi:hypothetical protein